jgi:CelD/BcsL family acetyltransferase involved in cellulose biosynthesis
MDVETIHPEELTSGQIDRWKEMLTPEQFRDTPFFHPEFVTNMSQFRPLIEIAIVTENSVPVAFFPFERHGNIGRPLGIKLSDFQGIIRSDNNSVNPQELLKGCDLKTWNFDHLIVPHQEFNHWHLKVDDSRYMDISKGYDPFLEERKQSGSSLISQIQRKKRKLEREHGPLRFEWQIEDQQGFDQLLQWKSDQRKNTNTFDILQYDWVTQFLDQIRNVNSAEFAGVLSGLYLKDQLIAIHLGMSTRTVLHFWFPTYDRQLSKYSPGLIMNLELAKHAAEKGIQRVDLGKGNETFKTSLGSAAIPVAEGAVELNPLRHTTRSLWFQAREWIRDSRLKSLAKIPKKIIRSYRTNQQIR